MEFDHDTRRQLALSGGIIGGLFAFLAIYNVAAFIGDDKPVAYIIALVASFCVIYIGTDIFSRLLQVGEK